jgi:deoxycytidylate deaminase
MRWMPQSGFSVDPNKCTMHMWTCALVLRGSSSALTIPGVSASGGDSVFKPELIFALVGPLGSGLSEVIQQLEGRLDPYRYRTSVVKVSSTFRLLQPWAALPTGPRNEAFYDAYMSAGDSLRLTLKRADAAALLAISQISEERETITGKRRRPANGMTFIIDSLKTPEEVALLRSVYGSRLFVLAAYAAENKREERLALEIANASGSDPNSHLLSASRIIKRDSVGAGADGYGQNVSGTFPLADFFLDCDRPGMLTNDLDRFLRLLFAEPRESPNRDEYGMYLARGAAMRSASMSRQVGAAITSTDGAVLALGCNEVPKYLGGQYWPGDDPDARDVVLGTDTSESIKDRLFRASIRALLLRGWQPPKDVAKSSRRKDLETQVAEIAKLIPQEGFPTHEAVEFYREVHAELAAIVDAAKRGVSTSGATLYTTTFPCHDCAKHIVAAGIQRVVFVEPYPKSRVAEMHPDSIDLAGGGSNKVRFETFVGAAPRRYSQFFRWGKRKDTTGTRPSGARMAWTEGSAEPRFEVDSKLKDKTLWKALQVRESLSIIDRENAALLGLSSAMSERGLATSVVQGKSKGE